MNLRTFLKRLPVVFFSTDIATSKPLHPPISALPGTVDEMIGLWVQYWDYDKNGFHHVPYFVIREFDDLRDTWKGQVLYNPRRNKLWARPMNSQEEVLICLERQDYHLRWFKNEPDTDWSLIGKGILW